MRNLKLLTILLAWGFVLPLCAQYASIPYRENLDVLLTTDGAVVSTPIGFAPEGDFSIEFSLQSSFNDGESVNLKAANVSGRGVYWKFSDQGIVDLADNESVVYSIPETEVSGEHLYRVVVQNGEAYLFRNAHPVGSVQAARLGGPLYKEIHQQSDGTFTGIYSPSNLVSNPGFEEEEVVLSATESSYKFWPSEWIPSGADAKEQQAMGVRCNKGDEQYANGREGNSALMFRQDGSGGFTAANGSYVYQKLKKPLKAGRRYKLTFQALSHVNDLGKTYAVGVGSAQGEWNYFYTTWKASSVKQTLTTYQYEFTVPVTAGKESYLAFICQGTTGICHLDRVTLEEADGEYNMLNLTIDGTTVAVGPLSYALQALSPERHITNHVVNNGEYHLYHTAYGRLLGEKADGVSPGLSVLGTNNVLDSYVFIAEAVGTDGYYRLRQKSSGRYLTVSTSSSNTWSVYLTEGVSTSDAYLWKLGEGSAGTIRSKYNGKLLGCDTGKESETHISVFYDKSEGEYSTWQIVEAGFELDEARLRLYIAPLEDLLVQGAEILSNSAYSADTKAALESLCLEGETLCQTATLANVVEIEEMTVKLEEAVKNCLVANSVVWFSGYDFEVGQNFTVALNGVTRKADAENDPSLILRGLNGKGTLVKLATDYVEVGKEQFSLPSVVLANASHDYQLAVSGDGLILYVDSMEVAQTSLYDLDSWTTVGKQPEFSAIGIQSLSAYRVELLSNKQALSPLEVPLNAQGKEERKVAAVVNQQWVLERPIDIHLTASTKPLQSSKIALNHEDAWVIFDNILPSDVVSQQLSFIQVSGKRATNGSTVRVAIYLQGAVVIPHGSSYKPFTGYSGELYAGDAVSYRVGRASLGKSANTFQSFTLKRGYMVCLATNSDGSGYSRVFVADHADLEVPVLPEALNQRISYVNIKKWNYVSKKGWCSTKGNSSIANDCEKMRATWFYTWSADRNSTLDTEYVPIKQHLYWPSWEDINGLTDCTHVLSLNEPEHSEQHTSDQCSCGGVISEWKSCTITPNFQTSGMRIGSPAPTDAGWLTTYINHCNDMAYRCDFVAIHCYWGTNEAANVQAWYNRLKDIYNKTKRPIWITEWNNGASWTTESWPEGYGDKLEKNRKAIKEIVTMLDTCSFIERYSIYNWDSYYRAMIADDGWVTPAGEEYRNYRSTFAYNAKVQYIPHWWAPSLKDISATFAINRGTMTTRLTVKCTNPNGDMTERLIVQRQKEDSTWEDMLEVTDRSIFDNSTSTSIFKLEENEWIDSQAYTIRVKVITKKGETTYSEAQTIEIPSSIEESEDTQAIRYQDGIVYFEGNAQKAMLYAANGALVKEQSLRKETVMDLTSLPRGYYVVCTDKGDRLVIVK